MLHTLCQQPPSRSPRSFAVLSLILRLSPHSLGTGLCNLEDYNATYLRDICRHVSDWSSRKYDQVVWIGHSFMGACNFPVTMKTANQIKAFNVNGRI